MIPGAYVVADVEVKVSASANLVNAVRLNNDSLWGHFLVVSALTSGKNTKMMSEINEQRLLN